MAEADRGDGHGGLRKGKERVIMVRGGGHTIVNIHYTPAARHSVSKD